MLHFRASGEFLPRASPANNWGDFVVYVEVADDQHATRQLDAFENGNFLRYDRAYPRDAYGYLTGLKFSPKEKWRRFYRDAELLAEFEFEKIWRNAVRSSRPNRHKIAAPASSGVIH